MNTYKIEPSKDGFKSYFENGPVGMCVNSTDNVWIEINQEFCRLIGYEKEELQGMNWVQITHPDDIQANMELVEKIKNGDIDNFKFDKRYIRKNGSIIYATLSMVCVRKLDGSVDYMIVSFIDNTEHFHAVENLKREHQQLRTLIDNLPFPIYFIDKNGRKVISNKADLENIGCTEESVTLGKTDLELFPNEVGQRGHTDNMSVINTGNPILNREEDFLDKNGAQKWIQTTKIPLFDSNNQISGLVGIGLDVTQQRILQSKINESEAYYRTLVNISPDGIVVADILGHIDFLSSKVYEIVGIPESTNLIGESIFNWVAVENFEDAKSSFQDVLKNEMKRRSKVFKCIKFDGSEFWGEFSPSPLEDSKGQLKGVMIVIRDITSRKKAEEEIILAKTKAEESDHLKSAFLQNIYHEIRTPMNGIMGFMDILEDPDFSQTRKMEFAEIVKKSGQRLLNTIHEIVEISKIMTSTIELNPIVVNINGYIQDHYRHFKPFVEEKGLNFVLDCKTPVSANLLIDNGKLDSVVDRILDNAVKFTNEGTIELGNFLNGDDVVFYVKDTGIGIDTQKTNIIFEAFYQTDHDFNRKHEGAGLGLSISKAYVEMLGGKIWLESIVGQGSTFYFSIPFKTQIEIGFI